MIVGIGSDLVSIARMAALLERHPERALQRLFTPREVAECRQRGRPAASFAARFAAKEAFFKALGTGLRGEARWCEVEVASDALGAPSILLSGGTERLSTQRGARRVHVSLTHTDELAAAFVVLEG